MTPAELRNERLFLGYTQNRLAAVLGISRRQYLRYEHGQTPVSTPIAIIIGIMASGKVPPALRKSGRER